MKKLLLLTLLLLLISGCGERTGEGMAAPSPSPSVAVTRQPSKAPTQTPAPTLPSTPPPAPTPTPTPKPDFEEVQSPGPAVRLQYIDGETRPEPFLEIKSLLIDDLSYVKLTDLQQVYPWFQAHETEEGIGFSTFWGSATEPLKPKVTFRHVSLQGISGRCVQTGDGLWVPLRTAAEVTGLYVLWDSENRVSYVSQIPNKYGIPQGVKVPTLMYHEVAEETWGLESLFVKPENMRAQLAYLRDNGFDTIFFSDLTHLSDFDKPVILTFDDGYIGNYENLFPLLKEFNMKATIFVIPDKLDTPEYLTSQQVREMANSGLVSIQSHSRSHINLGESSYEDQQAELTESQLAIARLTGRTPYVLSYPYGSFNDDTRALAGTHYSFAVKSLGGTWYTESSDYLTMERIDITRNMDLQQYARLLS